MVATSKSPRKILTVGYLIGKLALPDYAHKFSPKTYTQPQLFACLVLKEFLHRDYRGMDGCSTANLFQLSGRPENSGKVFLMTCQGGVWVRMLETATSGNVDVGALTSTWSAKLRCRGNSKNVHIVTPSFDVP